jgi:hypothetical protein
MIMKIIVYKQDGGIGQLTYFLDDGKEADFIPKDVPYYFLTDELLETVKDVPMDAWVIEGEPDGYGENG